VVVVSSCLWDIARLARHEPEAVSGPELAPGLLAAWAVNFTQVVALARATFPEVRQYAVMVVARSVCCWCQAAGMRLLMCQG
jgi:hypothetical protein